MAVILPASSSPATGGEPAGSNPLGKKWFSPRPNYRHCTDAGDADQLTDGKTTNDYFWTQQGTVGWSGAPLATIRVDLGRVEPIGGVALRTAAGRADVTWPMAVYVLVSDDGKTYRRAGDLVALNEAAHGPLPDDYAIVRQEGGILRTRGRYVQLVIVPLPGGSYLFTDEIEILRGPDDLLAAAPRGRWSAARARFSNRPASNGASRAASLATSDRSALPSTTRLSAADRARLAQRSRRWRRPSALAILRARRPRGGAADRRGPCQVVPRAGEALAEPGVAVRRRDGRSLGPARSVCRARGRRSAASRRLDAG